MPARLATRFTMRVTTWRLRGRPSLVSSSPVPPSPWVVLPRRQSSVDERREKRHDAVVAEFSHRDLQPPAPAPRDHGVVLERAQLSHPSPVRAQDLEHEAA